MNNYEQDDYSQRAPDYEESPTTALESPQTTGAPPWLGRRNKVKQRASCARYYQHNKERLKARQRDRYKQKTQGRNLGSLIEK